MNNQDLAKIVKQVQSNKEKHFEKLFSEIYRTIYYLSLKFLNNETEAQDVSQDIILYIYNHIEELKVPGSFNRWMNRIIYSECKNRVKKLFRRKEDDYEEHCTSGELPLKDNPEEFVQTKEKEEFILDIINSLPKKQREVVLLYYYQQLTTPEIAYVLSCSLPSIQNRLYNAKKAIRNRVEESKTYTTEQLFGIGGIPILAKFLNKEAKQIVPGNIKELLWLNIISNKKVSKYKPNGYWFCIVCIFIILLSRVLVGVLKTFNETTQQEKNILEIGINTIHNKESNHKREEEQITEILITEKLSTKKRQSNSQVQTKEETTQQVEEQTLKKEQQQWSWRLSDQSIDKQIAIWDGEVEKEYTNIAILEDEDLEELKYSHSAKGKAENEALYEEEAYKKKSEIIYHTAIMPVVSLEKSSLLEQDKITYYLHLKNIGEVAAYNLIVKDTVPEYTEFIQMIQAQSDVHLEIITQYQQQIETIFWTIEQLNPTQSVTLAFQVKILEEEWYNNREIRNIAYLKVGGKEDNAEDYLRSNEIIYIMEWKQEKLPQTDDNMGVKRMYILLTLSSFILISCIVTRKNKRSHNVK